MSYSVCACSLERNQVPGRLWLTLTTPFELVHKSKPNSNTWFELFSIIYINHDKDNAKSRSKLQAHTLYDISVGKDYRSNSIIFYNPITYSYYLLQLFRLSESRLPINNFSNKLRFDGGLTCSLLRNNTDPIHEPFPPGTRVSIQHNNTLSCGTIKNIPIPVSPILRTEVYAATELIEHDYITLDEQNSPLYVILLDYGITI